MTVLVLASDRDPTADQMINRLAERDVQVCRIDTGWFPAQLTVDAELRAGRWCGRLRTPGRTVRLEDVHAVWFRSPTAFRFPQQWSNVERQHSHNEAKFGLGGVLSSLPVLWVNHPNRMADAVYKPRQLAVAAAVGLHVPDTLVTNDPAAVRRFATGAEDASVVTKALGAPTIFEEGRRKVGLTRRVRHADLTDLAGVEWTVHQFQRWVPKAHDLRLVVVDGRQFAVAIHSDTVTGYLDFRSDYGSLRYELVDVPDSTHAQVDLYMDRFGLRYGAFDFVVDHDGRWWFLECNPGGQYGWLETATGAPMTEALADLLTDGTTT